MKRQVIRLGEAINFTLTPMQKKIDADPARFKILKIGRRGAKTYYEAYFTAKNALRGANRLKHWYVTTTLALAREEFWPVLLDLLPPDLVAKVDDRLLVIRLTTGATIYCKSAEKEKNLRGRALGSIVVDEAAFLRAGLWDQVLRPQLAGSCGPALLASSPKKGWFTQLYNKVVQEKIKDWATFHGTIYDNPHISRDEIETIKATTLLNTWLQEYMAEEISETGVVYDEFGGQNLYDPRERFQDVKTFATVRGLDWGTDDPAACVWVGVSPEGHLVVSEEHEQNNWDPSRHSEVILSKSTGYSRIHASALDGTAFRKESDLTSVADQFRQAGIPCQRGERGAAGSLAIVKRFMRGSDGIPWLHVSAKCGKLIAAIQNWEHGDHEPDVAAALRYAVTWAVTHRLTKLSDVIPKSAPMQKVGEEQAKIMLAQHARIVPANRKRAWSWDHAAGAPN